jgi:hypothetical protein
MQMDREKEPVGGTGNNKFPTMPLLNSSRLLTHDIGSTPSSASFEESVIPQQVNDAIPPPGIDERKLMRKIDIRLLPVLCILYLLAFLDRYVQTSSWECCFLTHHSVNISNAAIFGLKEDLSLGGVEYNTALTIFFVPYISIVSNTSVIIVYITDINCQSAKFLPISYSSVSSLIYGVSSFYRMHRAQYRFTNI